VQLYVANNIFVLLKNSIFIVFLHYLIRVIIASMKILK